jgi:hypothetical protein
MRRESNAFLETLGDHQLAAKLSVLNFGNGGIPSILNGLSRLYGQN